MIRFSRTPLPGDVPLAGQASAWISGAPGLIWTLLVLNTLGSGGEDTIFPVPTLVAQAITMGELALAFGIALLCNPRVYIRPSGYLLLLSLLLVVSIAASLRMQSGVGALARCARLAAFLATLWLLTGWLGSGIAFVRYHVRALAAILLTVILGLVIAPGTAMPDSYDGRLVGALWYLTPPQVAQYAAVAAGLTVVLWLSRVTTAASVLWLAVPAGGLLLLTHTRTALAGLVAGLVIAGGTLSLVNTRARRAVAVAAVGAVVAAAAIGPAVLDWLRRGQGQDALQSLTGRQQVWDSLLADDRSVGEQILGVGLTDKSFDGLPIDSTWFAVYYEQGLVGVAIVALVFAYLIVVAIGRPPCPERACAIFLIAYCLVASYTEVGIGDASPYILHLALASMLLARSGTTAREAFSAGGQRP